VLAPSLPLTTTRTHAHKSTSSRSSEGDPEVVASSGSQGATVASSGILPTIAAPNARPRSPPPAHVLPRRANRPPAYMSQPMSFQQSCAALGVTVRQGLTGSSILPVEEAHTIDHKAQGKGRHHQGSASNVPSVTTRAQTPCLDAED
jgi:hypothetical protein